MMVFTEADLRGLPEDMQPVAYEGLKLLKMSGLIPRKMADRVQELASGVISGDDADELAAAIIEFKNDKDTLMSLHNLV